MAKESRWAITFGWLWSWTRIDRIKYAKDMPLALLLAAQARGWSLSYVEQRDLRLRDGVAEGKVRALSVHADPQHWYTLAEPTVGTTGAPS